MNFLTLRGRVSNFASRKTASNSKGAWKMGAEGFNFPPGHLWTRHLPQAPDLGNVDGASSLWLGREAE
jgi:hypothetical protein